MRLTNRPGAGRAAIARRPAVAAVAMAVAAVATAGLLGWGTRASPPGFGGPAAAASPGPAAEETPGVSDPTAGPVPAAGTGRDPLTPAEASRARTIAVDPALVAETTDVTGSPGPEYLSFELAEPPAGGDTAGAARRAALYFYDYAADRLIKRVVDLTAGRLEGSYAASQMQPPATPREVEAALALLLADAAGDVLRSRYATVTGDQLTSAEQLVVTAQIFVTEPAGAAQPAEAAGQGGARDCGRHRCLILLPRQPGGGPFIDISDVVVDLSGRGVVRLS
jgi:hypothetical protein